MATCSAGPARCKIVCTGGCGCVYLHEADSCVCECFDDDATGLTGTVGLGTVVSVTIKGLALGQFASRLDRLLTREVMVPASRSADTVTLKLRRVRMSQAIKTLGLSTRPKSGRPRRRTRRRG
jgi:hypothetical protein